MKKSFEALLNLNFNEIKIISESIKDLNDDRDTKILTLKIQGVQQVRRCPICNSGKIKRFGKKLIVQKGVRHAFMSTYVVVELDIYKRRYICEECSRKNNKKTTFTEKFSFLDERNKHTKAFEIFVLKDWKYLSVLELSRKFNTSDKMIWTIIKKLNCDEKLQENLQYLSTLKEIYLGIDEHSFRGHDYVLIITELLSNRVIGVLPSITQLELKKWLNNLPPKIMQKINGYATDMHKGYANVVKEVLGGKSLHTVDPAHLVFLGNKITDQVRQMNDWMIKMGYFEKERRIDLSTKDGLKRGRKKKKLTHIQLQKQKEPMMKPMEHRTLFLYAEEKLSKKQQDRINQLFKDSDPKGYVFEAWSQKEIVREALQKKDITLIDKAIKDAKNSTHYLIKGFGKTLTRWYEGIKNYMELEITNACTEAKNNIAKLFKRMAFGYRNKNNYVKKLYFCL
jgi:transposase